MGESGAKPLSSRAAFAGVVILLEIVFLALIIALGEYDPATIGPKTVAHAKPDAPDFA